MEDGDAGDPAPVQSHPDTTLHHHIGTDEKPNDELLRAQRAPPAEITSKQKEIRFRASHALLIAFLTLIV